MMHFGELNWEQFGRTFFALYLATNEPAWPMSGSHHEPLATSIPADIRARHWVLYLRFQISTHSESGSLKRSRILDSQAPNRRVVAASARSRALTARARGRPLGSPPNAMATLAAALLLFPLSARGKKRGKRKPDASTVAASMQYHQRGTMAHVHGDIDGAKQAFREAIKLKPDFSYAYYRLAFVMHEQAQQERLRQQKEEGPLRPTEDPVPVFREAIRLDGRDEMYYYSLGQALKDQLDLQGAVDTFSAVTRFNPRSAQAYWAIGKVRTSTQRVGTRRARAVACPLRRCMPRPATSSIRTRMIPMTPAISTRSP